MKKINVIGTSGSGKSTFSKRLAQTLNIKYIEMDLLFWKANWQQSNNDEFFAKINQEVCKNEWVLDGNYSRSQQLKWQHADTIIWLDYGFWRTFYQVFVRSIKRAWYRNELWQGTGNKESFFRSFCHKDSIILWMLTNYHANRRKYLRLMESDQVNDKRFIHLTTPSQAKQFLEELKSKR